MKAVWNIFVFVLAATTTVTAQSVRSLVHEGNRFYEEQRYTDAEVNYRKALEENREFPQGIFNLGDALYKQGRFDEAATHFQSASQKVQEQLTRAQAYHNLGNALLKGEKIQESIAAYKEALKLNPRDLDTKYNLEYAKSLLREQKQKKNQQRDRQQNMQDKQQPDQSQQSQTEQQQSQQDQRQQQQKKQQVSKEDAERILEALKNEEQNVQKKLQKKIPARISVEKDW